jgi:ABC-type Mn2+/Zn2+ transport system ATPase subunit
MDSAILTFEHLSIGYNGEPVLADISLSINRGSFTAILGSNGSGKSTMLKTIIGLIPPVAGRITVAAGMGAPMIFGYVPQSNALDSLYPFTGFDVALMGAYGRIKPGRFVSAKERAFTHVCLEAAGAQTFARARFAELSGGQKQRVLIARALVTRPDVLVLDEPTAGVDAAATHAVLEFISKLHREKEITVLLVTHDLPIVREHAQHVIWLHQGRIMHGPASEMLMPERLASIFEMEVG